MNQKRQGWSGVWSVRLGRTLREQKTPFSRDKRHGSGRYLFTPLATKSQSTNIAVVQYFSTSSLDFLHQIVYNFAIS